MSGAPSRAAGRAVLLCGVAVGLFGCAAPAPDERAPTTAASARRPNVVVVMADDVGVGDLGCYGADPARVRTPHMDRLAREGRRFDRAYAAAACCTPSRFAFLTATYPFREPRAAGVLPGDAPLAIRPGSPTLPQVFADAGYATGFVGKWHLGLGEAGKDGAGAVDWNGELAPGPREIGFGSCFYMPSTGDRTPCVLVRDRRVVGLDPSDPLRVSHRRQVGDEPTGKARPERLDVLGLLPGRGHDGTIVRGVSRIGWSSGGAAAAWRDEELSDTLAAEARAFLRANAERPFLLYFAPHGIHEPKVPHPRFRGTSGAGVYGDQLHELDDAVGVVLSTLDELGLADDTLVVLTSDNGGTDWIAYDYARFGGHDLRGHRPNGALRGEKFTPYEGGTRVPQLVRWPGRVAPGSASDAVVCHVDLFASLAKVCGAPLPPAASPDGLDLSPALFGAGGEGRRELPTTVSGRRAQLRVDGWKFIPAENGRPAELYDLRADPAETTNLADVEPERADAMAARLSSLLASPPASRPMR